MHANVTWDPDVAIDWLEVGLGSVTVFQGVEPIGHCRPGMGLLSLPRNFASLGKSIKLMKRCQISVSGACGDSKGGCEGFLSSTPRMLWGI